MKRRIIAVLMAAVLLMAVCPTAFAEEEPVITQGDILVNVESVATASMSIDMEVKITVDPKLSSGTLTLNSVTATAGVLNSNVSFSGITSADLGKYDNAIDVVLKGVFKGTLSGEAIEQFKLSFTYEYEDGEGNKKEEKVEKAFTYKLTATEQPSSNTDPTKNTAAFMLSSYDTNGLIVSTASGKNGGKVTVRLPLLCVDGPVSNIKATPKISTSLDEFPFAVEQIDYTLSYAGAIGTNQVIEFQFNMRFADKVTAGVKKVDFTVTYDRGWGSAEGTTTESCDISLYVNVTKGYEGADSTNGSGTTTQTLPKLVVDSYQFSTEKIEAGDIFDLTFTVRNTSSDEDVKSILVTVSNNAETGKLTPAEGSNTLYIDKLAKGESKTMTMSIATAADTEAKAYEIKLDFEYEGSKSRPESLAKGEASASIPVTVMQKIRLKIDDPTVDGEAMEGESVPVYFSIYNMGRSAIYNCIITVEGDGLSLEDSFFQGTLAAGNSLRADLSVITATPGQIDGEIVITYEDSLEEQKEERLPLSLYVTEAYTYDDTTNIDDGYIDYNMDDTSSSSGMPVWVWIVIGVVVAGAAVAAIVLLKKKRAKDLEDI